MMSTPVASDVFEIDSLLDLVEPALRMPFHLSPDGRWLALAVQRNRRTVATSDVDFFTPNGVPMEAVGGGVVVVPTRGGGRVEPFAGAATSWAPRWSPDGRRLAAFVEADGPACLAVWTRETDEVRRFPNAPARAFFNLETPVWTPDGRSIVTKVTPESSREVAAGKESGSAAEAFVEVLVHDPGADDGARPTRVPGYLARARADLAAVDVATGALTRLAAGTTCFGWRVSPVGSRVAFLRAGDPDERRQQNLFDLVAAPLDGSAPRVLARRVPQSYGVCFGWSPTGDRIAYTTKDRGERGRLFVVAADGATEPDELSRHCPDDLARDEEPPRWSPDGDTVYCLTSGGVWAFAADGTGATLFGASEEGRRLTLVDPESMATRVTRAAAFGREIRTWLQPTGGDSLATTADGAVLLLARDRATKRESVLKVSVRDGAAESLLDLDGGCRDPYALDAAPASNLVCLALESATAPPSVSRLEFGPRAATTEMLTLNPSFPARALGRSQLVAWVSLEGEVRNGALMLPPAGRFPAPYPLLVHVYGGWPLSDNIHRFGFGGKHFDQAHLFASRGYAVLYADAMLPDRDPMRHLPGEVLPAIHRLVELGIADEGRVGLFGHSYGGYCVLSLLTQTNLFRAAVASAGIYDLASMYGGLSGLDDSFGVGWSETGQGRMGGTLWERRAAYVENSPLFYLDRVQTPLLLVWGSADFVPKGQADEVFSGLRRLGKRVELRRYRDQDHWPGLWTEPSLRDLCNRVIEWFDEHLTAEERADVPNTVDRLAAAAAGVRRSDAATP